MQFGKEWKCAGGVAACWEGVIASHTDPHSSRMVMLGFHTNAGRPGNGFDLALSVDLEGTCHFQHRNAQGHIQTKVVDAKEAGNALLMALHSLKNTNA